MKTIIIMMEKIRKEGRLLFESVRGSHLFGLATETSDLDTFGIYIDPIESFLGLPREGVPRMIKDEKSDNYWDELEKFIRELGNSNPEALVSIFTPAEHILLYNPILDPLWAIRDELVTKKCFKSFAGYAYSQIKKAKGYNKAVNIPADQVKERKTPLSFCQVPVGGGTWTLEKFLRDWGLKQELCGISRLPGTIEGYALYYDWAADKDLSEDTFMKFYARINDNMENWELDKWRKTYGILLKHGSSIGYRGILDPDDKLSSQLRMSSIPKAEASDPVCYFQFNSGAYSQHCQDYKRYWDWVKNRNPERFKLNEGYNFDGKNLSHCVRIMTMAIEIAQGKGLILDRAQAGDREFLLDIKNHRLTYDEIMKYVEELKEKMEKAFEESTLPEEPNLEKLEKVLISIRKEYYGIINI